MFIKKREEKELAKKRKSIKSLDNVFDLSSCRNISELYTYLNGMNDGDLTYELITFSEKDELTLYDYKENHKHISNIKNKKYLERLNNIFIEYLMDTNKQIFNRYIIFYTKNLSLIEDIVDTFKLKKISEIDSFIIPKGFFLSNIDKYNGVFEIMDEFENVSYIKQIKLNKKHFLYDYLIAFHAFVYDKTNTYIYKKFFSKDNIYLFMRNDSKDVLMDDFNKLINNRFIKLFNIIIEEKYINVNDLYYALPFNNKNKLSNNTKIESYAEDSDFNNKNKQAHLVFESDRINSFIREDFKEDSFKNFLVFGDVGSGKSYLNKYIILNSLMNNEKVSLISTDNYERFTEMIGGECVNVNSFSSFPLFWEDMIEEDLVAVAKIISILVLGENIPLNFLHYKILKAVKDTYFIFKEESSLKLVHKLLSKDKHFRKTQLSKLNKYIGKNGEYFQLFNGNKKINFSNDFIYFDLRGISSNPLLFRILSIYLAQQITVNYRVLNRGKKIIFENTGLKIKDLKEVLRENRLYDTFCGIVTSEKIPEEFLSYVPTIFNLIDEFKISLEKNFKTEVEVCNIPSVESLNFLFNEDIDIVNEMKIKAKEKNINLI